MEIKNKKLSNKNEEKLPNAVFVFQNYGSDEICDYKQIFTNIISNRIKEKYLQ